MGGEEFALLLPDTDMDEACELAERLLELLQRLDIRYQGHTIRPSASFGIATLTVNDQGLEALMLRADRALYQSKDQGRGRVSIARP